MKQIYNFINKYKKEIIVILILIIISIGIYYFYYRENFINEGFFTTTTPIINQEWTLLGQEIDGEAADDYSGRSVSLSSDGTIVAIGANSNDGDIGSDSGHVRIYKYDGTSWTLLGQEIDGEAAGDNSGKSVSLSSDGTIVAIGAQVNDGSGRQDSGHVRIYKYDGTSWGLLGQEIDGEATGDYSGWSVSLSSDGTIVAIGAFGNDANGSNSGHVRVFKYDGTNWGQIGNDIDGEVADDYSGKSVSLSSDGTIVAIGADGNNGVNVSDSGHVRIYKYDGTRWTLLGQEIDGEAADDYSGRSVSLSSDGTIVAIGAPYNDGNGFNSGHVRIYKYDGTSWGQIGNDIAGEAANNYSGGSVSLSSDGTIVAIGAFGNDGDNGSNSGHVRIYKYDGTSWGLLGQEIDGEAGGDHSGKSVSLSSDGTIVAIGAIGNDGNGSNSGHVRIYELKTIQPTTTMMPTTTTVPPTTTTVPPTTTTVPPTTTTVPPTTTTVPPTTTTKNVVVTTTIPKITQEQLNNDNDDDNIGMMLKGNNNTSNLNDFLAKNTLLGNNLYISPINQKGIGEDDYEDHIFDKNKKNNKIIDSTFTPMIKLR